MQNVTKHTAHGVAQSPEPIYRHGRACLSKQLPWRAAGDSSLARGRPRVRALAPAGALHMIFSPPSLPSVRLVFTGKLYRQHLLYYFTKHATDDPFIYIMPAPISKTNCLRSLICETKMSDFCNVIPFMENMAPSYKIF